MNNIQKIYESLLSEYDFQGWWPIINSRTLLCEYCGGPKNEKEIFEVICGSMLTQNVGWDPNVVNALKNLKQKNLLSAKRILSCDEQILKDAIKPTGYYNQKARKLKVMAKFFIDLKGKAPTRDQLLALWGIGPETADSILLYAYNVPCFVVDAYTRRILIHHNVINEDTTYDEIKQLFETQLPKDATMYNEYHALLVEHAKQHYSKKPYGKNDFLKLEE